MGVGAAIKAGLKIGGKWLGKKALEKIAGKEEKEEKEKKEKTDPLSKAQAINKTLQDIFDEINAKNYYDDAESVSVNSGWHDDYDPETTEDQELDAKESATEKLSEDTAMAESDKKSDLKEESDNEDIPPLGAGSFLRKIGEQE